MTPEGQKPSQWLCLAKFPRERYSQPIVYKALSWSAIRKSACILAEITIRKSQDNAFSLLNDFIRTLAGVGQLSCCQEPGIAGGKIVVLLRFLGVVGCRLDCFNERFNEQVVEGVVLMDNKTQEIEVAEFVSPPNLEMLYFDGDCCIVLNYRPGKL